eukprot:1148678-Prorocentrum_minimum.AAC.1
MVCNVGPAGSTWRETLSTFQFSQQARKVTKIALIVHSLALNIHITALNVHSLALKIPRHSPEHVPVQPAGAQ